MSDNTELLYQKISPCTLCPNNCGVKRDKSETGICKLDDKLHIASIHLHFGEEPELVGRGGSGTFFFSGCNLKCTYCQNFDISWHLSGEIISVRSLADAMIILQTKGAENINLVTPTPQVPMIFDAIRIARKKGLRLPIVYNCGGYESQEVLDLLDGYVDIYMPDFKYGSSEAGKKYSQIRNYFLVAKNAVKKMHRQVGDLKVNQNGAAVKGLLIRHLVLPAFIADSELILDFIASDISLNTYVNIMDQYRPCYRAYEYHELKQHSVRSEYEEVRRYAKELGLHRGF